MPIITLTSDWRNNDYYLAAVKGRLLTTCPGSVVVDISHQISPFNLSQAAFVLKNCYLNFPDDTIHLIAVKDEASEKAPHVLVHSGKHHFITADNGIFGLLLDEEPEEVVSLHENYPSTTSFACLEVFCPVACDLSKGRKYSEIGSKYEKLNKQVPMLPAIDESVINGSVVYIDSYQNAVTNITRELFEQIGKNRRFDIFIQSNHYRVDRINTYYGQTTVGELLAVFNTAGALEVGINNGNAADLLNLSVGSVVRVKFYDK